MDHPQAVAEHVLAELRQWGWETTLSHLKMELVHAADSPRQADLRQFLGWMAAERGAHQEAIEQFRVLADIPGREGWACFGQAFVAMRCRDLGRAHELLDEARRWVSAQDQSLRGVIGWLRGVVLYHQNRLEQALPVLLGALNDVGADCLTTGRLLDALGMVYGARDNFHAARTFYEQALENKKRFGDDAGTAVTHGQLGRLYLDWMLIDQAEEHFKADLEIARRIEDRRGEAQMYDHLGQVALAKGDAKTAAAWLDESIRLNREGNWAINEAYAHKDRALAYVAAGELSRAQEEIEAARSLFREFAEGLAHVKRAQGMLERAWGRYQEAESALRVAATYFETHQELAEAARTRLELARTLVERPNTPLPLVTEALEAAVASAEASRRAALVRQAESELKAVDEAAYARHAYARVRGRGVRDDPVLLMRGVRESVTVMFLDVKGSTDFTRVTDPEIVMLTINQLMADLAGVVERYGVHVTQFLGDGFMALVRDMDHPRRAVSAAVDLQGALEEFNRPRRVLGLSPFEARIGISTGEVIVGNVGTYTKMDYTALGAPVNLAARLQTFAEPGSPCISRSTFERVREHFTFHPGSPRSIQPKGLDACEVWDVAGRT